VITDSDAARYAKEGYLILPAALDEARLTQIADRVEALSRDHHPGHVLEKHAQTYRAMHGCHLYDDTFRELIRWSMFVRVAEQLLGDKVYLHQLKINLKQPFCGESWPWHQDFIYWRNEDLIPRDAMISAMIYLDDVTDFNGPLFFIPQSHTAGCIESGASTDSPDGWVGNVSANLTYQVDHQTVTELAKQYGMVNTKGPRGTVVWFHGNLVHASPENISPFPRRLAILTYNAVSNRPTRFKETPRPDFLFGRDMDALEAI